MSGTTQLKKTTPADSNEAMALFIQAMTDGNPHLTKESARESLELALSDSSDLDRSLQQATNLFVEAVSEINANLVDDSSALAIETIGLHFRTQALVERYVASQPAAKKLQSVPASSLIRSMSTSIGIQCVPDTTKGVEQEHTSQQAVGITPQRLPSLQVK